jgi:hypothetical protein
MKNLYIFAFLTVLASMALAQVHISSFELNNDDATYNEIKEDTILGNTIRYDLGFLDSAVQAGTTISHFSRPDSLINLPYTENFDGVIPNILIYPTDSWVIGMPSKTFLSSAHSAPNAMVTRSLTASYNANENMTAILEINTTTLVRDINVSFWQKFTTEYSHDAMVLEYSTDHMLTWAKLDPMVGNGVNYNTATSSFWYNNNRATGSIAPPKWSSSSNNVGSDVIYQDDDNGWINSSTRIPYTIFESAGNLELRWRFQSDSSMQYDGFAIDDISIYQVEANQACSISPPYYDFGLRLINSISTQSFSISNTGTGPISISSIAVSGNPCFALINIPALPVSITAGQTAIFTMQYLPTASGTHNATVSVTDNLSRDVHSVNISGEGDDPTIITFPWTMSFDGTEFAPWGWTNTRISGSGIPGNWDRQITGTNPACSPHSGVAMARFNSLSYANGTIGDLITPPIAIPGGNAMKLRFWMFRDEGFSDRLNEGIYIYQNSSPTSIGGTLLGSYHRFYGLTPEETTANQWYRYTINLPIEITSTTRYIIFEGWSEGGNNIFLDDISLQYIPTEGFFEITPIDKDFGSVQLNMISSQIFMIENSGSSQMTINNISLSATSQFFLNSLPVLPLTLNSEESASFNVVFAPTAAGVHISSIIISDDLSRSTHYVNLIGNGFDTTINMYPHTENFDSVITPDLPEGWNAFCSSGYVSTSSLEYQSQPNSALIYTGFLPTTVILISPPMGISINQLKVRFYAKGLVNGDILTVGSVSSIYNPDTFTPMASVTLNNVMNLYEIPFTGHTGTGSYIAFKNGNTLSTEAIYLDDVTFLKIFNQDLCACSVHGNNFQFAGTTSGFTVSVLNNGLQTVSDYDVNLRSDEGTLLGSVHVTAHLAPGATTQHIINWTPSVPGNYHIYGQVVLAGDQVSSNDHSPERIISVLEADNAVLSIGDNASTTTVNTYPFDFYYCNSLAESIYYWDEMHLISGQITALTYRNNFFSNLTGMPVKIWMGTTSATSLSAGWIPSTSLTLVFDGVIDFPSGVNEIAIRFQTPFNYTGGNLVIRTNRPWEYTFHSSYDLFFCTSTANYSNRTRYLYSDTVTYNPLNPSALGTLVASVPNTSLVIDNATLAQETILEGFVTEDGTTPPVPVEGAVIILTDSRYTTTTDANGYYQFSFWENHTANVEVNKPAYYTANASNVNLVMGNSVTLNFNLVPLPRVNVSGTVIGNDIPALSNAAITLSSIETYNATSGPDGTFSFQNVLGSDFGLDCTLAITKPGYQSYVTSVTIYSDNVSLGNFTLNEPNYPAYNPVAIEADSNVILNWIAAGPPLANTYDFETTDGGFTATNSTTPGWAWGTSSYAGAHGGTKIWGCYLSGNYALNSTYELVSPSCIIGSSPILTFWHRYYLENNYDGGRLLVSIDDGATWTVIIPAGGYPSADIAAFGTGTYPGYCGLQTTWTLASFDLIAYAYQTIKLKWQMMTDNSINYNGWFIDDVFVGQLARYNVHDLNSTRGVDRSLQSYKVYRLLATDTGTPANWTLLAQNVTNISFTDAGWANLPGGDFKWAVKAVYSGELESIAILSNTLTHSVSLTPPQNLVITRIGPDIQLDWTVMTGATSYRVFCADAPYAATWILLDSTTTNQYLIPGVADPYKFYRVTAVLE